MRFSIIIPNYNCGKYLNDCLDSIFNQTFKYYEVIVVDDGSTDNSVDVIEKYDVKLLKTNRLYAGGARNKGLSVARGEYVLFLDSDDYLYNDLVLEKLNDKIVDEDIVYLGFYHEKRSLRVSASKLSKEERIQKDVWLGCPSKCWRRKFITWEFPEKMFLEDVYFVLKGYCEVEKFTELEGMFFYYRYRKNSSHNSKERENYRKASRDHIRQLAIEYPLYKNLLEKRL